MKSKRSSSSHKQQQKTHWALQTCSNVQMVLTIPMLILLALSIIACIFLLIARLTKPKKTSTTTNDKELSIGFILFVLVISSILFFGTIWVYRRHPAFLCYILIANLLVAILTSLAR